MSKANESKNIQDIEVRKKQHIDLCLNENSQANRNVFDAYSLPYRALPEVAFEDVSTEAGLCGKRLSQPLIIASMTGGSEHAKTINTNLAIAAENEGVALGVGSQRIGLDLPDAEQTFKLVRKHAPNAFLFANMGAVQLNYGKKPEDYRRVVEMINANALYLHINPLQEAIQPGGDTDYRGLIDKIAMVVDAVSVPVFAKEVGHGIDIQTAQALIAAGVQGIDVAGVGGTSYAWVEAQRAKNDNFAEWFKEVGIPTDQAIKDIANLKTKATLVASGGVRSPLDGLKAHALGADLYSAATPFLKTALESAEAAMEQIQIWQNGLRIALFVSGRSSW